MDKSLLPASIKFYELSHEFDTAEELLVIIACIVFDKFRDRSLIDALIELSLTELLMNERAKAILKNEVDKPKKLNPAKGKGHPKRNFQQQKANRKLGNIASYYVALGYPKSNNPVTSKVPSAARLVANQFFKSEKTVSNAMKGNESQFYKNLAVRDKLNNIERTFCYFTAKNIGNRLKSVYSNKYYRDFQTIIQLMNLK